MTKPTLLLTLVAGFCPVAFGAGTMTISQEVNAEYVYVGGATTRGAGREVGSVDENNADIKYVVSPQITKDLLLRFGVEWQRLSFGVPNDAPVPGLLQQISAVWGVDYQFAEQWLLRVEAQPGLYSDSSDVRWDNLDVPVVLGAAYLKSPDLQWFFGLRVDARSQYPVLPAAGVRWKFSDEWTLNFVLPNPRLEYDVNERLQFYCGAGLDAGTFRVANNFGRDHGLAKLDNAVVDYTEIRIGVGAAWNVLPNVTVDAGAGYLPYRSFDFFDRDIVFRSHNAPYGQVACHARF
jgi:opacity protein-like surface antigen